MLSRENRPVPPEIIRIRAAILVEMVAYAASDPERETCGLLAGRDGVITVLRTALNASHSPVTAYEIAPQELFRIFREIRRGGFDFLGIYHSHPATDNAPSPADIALAYYPDVAYFIVSPHSGAPAPIRAFHIREGVSTEIMIERE
jgi:[CysO sulfur-carrier protein]-S-L-cysteine hydrolase